MTSDADLNDKPPVRIKDIIHDAVIGDEITVWFEVPGREPIGVTMPLSWR